MGSFLVSGVHASARLRFTTLGLMGILGFLIASSMTPTATARATPANVIITPERFGARGNGRTDDSAALQRTFDQAGPGITVALSPGHVYLHNRVLLLRRAGMHLTGKGVLQATNASRSSVWIEANNVLVDGGVVFRGARTNHRWQAWEQMGVRIFGHRGITLRAIVVDSSAAAGIYVGNQAGSFTIDHVTVQNTRADGIHMTMGSHNGRVIASTTRNTGDDGIAVVSYARDGAPCHDITISSPHVRGTTWGRGLSVVGGVRIHETNIDVRTTSAAGVYIAAEGSPWFTAAPVDVTVTGGTILGANTNRTVDHGAVLVLAGESGPTPTNVTITGLHISQTRKSATRNVGVITYGRAPKNVLLSNFTITGGPGLAYQGNTPAGAFHLRNWTHNGVRVANR